jgi:hypothetical protein
MGAEWSIGQPLLDFLQSHAVTICDRQGQAVPTARLATMRALQEGQRVDDEQEVIHHADGTELTVLVNAVPFTDPELLTGLVATVGNGQAQAAESAALVVHQQVQKLKEGKKTSS